MVYLEPVLAAGQTPFQALINPNGSFQVVGGNAGNPGDFFKADKDNFGPNISFAYTPDFGNGFLSSLLPGGGRTVLRGGYRVNFVNDEYVRAPDNANLNNVGLGATTAFARLGGTLAGSSQFRAIGLNNAPTVGPSSPRSRPSVRAARASALTCSPTSRWAAPAPWAARSL